MYRDKIIDDIIISISNMCNNSGIIMRVKRLLNDATEFINVSKCSLYGKIYNEEFEINVSDNYFMVYFTSWSSTARNKIVYFKDGDRTILSFTNNEICEGKRNINNYVYHFINNNLVYATSLNSLNIDSSISGKIRKNVFIEVYCLDDGLALKKINDNGCVKYLTTYLYNESMETLMDYGFIGSKMDQIIEYDEFKEKIINFKRW